jgi:hypothetical protein
MDRRIQERLDNARPLRAAVSALLVLAVAVLPAAAEVADDARVVPGERIGGWSLTMTIDELVRLNGPKRAVGAPEGETVIELRNLRDSMRPLWAHRWDHLRVRAVTFERDAAAVEGLTTSDARFRTAQGIGVGSSRAEVERAYGPPTAVTDANGRQVHVIYDELGITFRVSNDRQQVDLVNVFPARTARTRWRIP